MLRTRSGLVGRTASSFAASLVAVAAGAASVEAQTWPARPVTFVISFSAGGVADIIARLVQTRLGERGVGTFVVENRPGAGGNVAARFVSTAPADGYTVLATTNALAVTATASRNKGYQLEDLRAVTISAITPDVMAVHPSRPIKTMKELMASGGEKGISYGTSGFGTAPYIGAAYLFQELAKVKAAHVPFNGGGPAVAAAIGNHVDVIVVSLPTAQAQIEQGQLRALGIPAAKRSAAFPGIPTYAEAGYPELFSATWVGFFVPTKTPEDVVAKLNGGITDVLKTTEGQQKMRSIGFEPLVMSPKEATDYVAKEVAIWGKMSRAIGYTMD